MDIGKMAVEEFRTALGDRADDIASDVYQAISDGAAAARQALGSDVLYENFLARQARRLQAGEEQEAESERMARRRFSQFLDYGDTSPPAAPDMRQYLER